MSTATQDRMTTSRFAEALQNIILESDGDFDLDGDTDAALVESVSNFDEAGVMTYNDGLVVRMTDGTEFQVTIVQAS